MTLHHDTALKFEQAQLFTVIRRSGSTAQGYFYAPNGSSQVIPPPPRDPTRVLTATWTLEIASKILMVLM
jgi:hypothetical protein